MSLKIKRLQEVLGILEDGGEAATGVVGTTSSDIAYLPSGFTSVSKALQDLAKMKRDWDLEVVRGSGERTLSFGKDLNIRVKDEHWSHFVKNIGSSVKALSKKGLTESKRRTVDISNVLREATGDEIKRNILKLEEELNHMLLERSIFGVVDDQISWWKSLFGGSDLGQKAECVISASQKRECIEKMAKEASVAYGDDLGGLQELINRVRSKAILENSKVDFAYFQGFKFLYGGIVASGDMCFETYVDKSFKVHSAVYLNEVSGVDEFMSRDFALIGKMLIPKRGYFSLSEMKNLKADLEDKD